MFSFVNLLLLFSLTSLVLGGAQVYVMHRVTQYFALRGVKKYLLILAFIVIGVVMVMSLPMARMMPRELAAPFAWIGFTWMGLLMFMAAGFALTDAGLIGHYLATRLKDVEEVDLSRRHVLKQTLGVGVLGVAGVMSGVGVNNVLRDVVVRPVNVQLKNLPPLLSGMTIAQLSDVHVGPTIDGKWLRTVVETTNALGADMIVITGDLVDGSVEALRKHVAPLADLKAPHGVFFITGNHEYYSGVDAWVEHIASLGIKVLRNEGVVIKPRGGEAGIYLAGVEDYRASHFSMNKQDIPQAMQARPEGMTSILLAHQPIAIHEAAEHKVDLQLSGHTHGGQVVPFNFAVSMQQPYVRGLHTHQSTDTQIYVSSGTGFWGPPMRLGTSSEVSLIKLNASQS